MLWREFEEVLRELRSRRRSKVEEENLQADNLHMLISIPPKYSVAQVVGFLKGKSAIYIARNYLGRRNSMAGQHFWARGYYVSTVGKDEESVRMYIKEQEQADRRSDQMNLFK